MSAICEEGSTVFTDDRLIRNDEVSEQAASCIENRGLRTISVSIVHDEGEIGGQEFHNSSHKFSREHNCAAGENPQGDLPRKKTSMFNTASMALASLGVVFGDIGTSPLYTPITVFTSMEATEDNVLGVTSSMIWLVNIVVTLKYVTLIMRHDNMGEGGIMALTTLASKSSQTLSRPWWKLATLMTGNILPSK